MDRVYWAECVDDGDLVGEASDVAFGLTDLANSSFAHSLTRKRTRSAHRSSEHGSPDRRPHGQGQQPIDPGNLDKL
jgi:hypothetical protein